MKRYMSLLVRQGQGETDIYIISCEQGKEEKTKLETVAEGEREEFKGKERVMERGEEDNCRKGGLLVCHYPQTRGSQTKAVSK